MDTPDPNEVKAVRFDEDGNEIIEEEENLDDMVIEDDGENEP